MDNETIERAKEHFAHVVVGQLARVERMKQAQDWLDYASLKPIIIGVCGGDGIGPYISGEAQRVLAFLLEPEVAGGKVTFRTIEGLTIENRAAHNAAIPEDVLKDLKECHVILKGPTTTPRAGDPWANIESANVAMRRELDLFANVRPVRVPKQGIDWTFFRENTEGAYILGSHGVNVTEDLAIDFTAVTTQGSERIITLAFEHARRTGANRVTVVTKANVIKTTDGKFLDTARRIAKDYP
ncbi:MAG: isocitrate/isopropylmalate family dehydrogenase, partial [Vicinamibacterales bacterium]